MDARIVELQNDVTELTAKLQSKENLLKQWERDKGNLVSELRAQNTRLTAQIKDSTAVESHLQQQIEELKSQCALDKINLQEHISSVGGLRDELDLLTEKNKELERRLHVTGAERDALANALEEASDRILMLERHAREHEMRYQRGLRDSDTMPQMDKRPVENSRTIGKVFIKWA